jgi:membrane-associated phospholipid phosphatase
MPLVVGVTLVSAPILPAADALPSDVPTSPTQDQVEPAAASESAIDTVGPAPVDTSASPFARTSDRRLDRYAANLGRNLKGVLARGSARPLLFGAGLALAGSLVDNRTVGYFDHHPYSGAGKTGATLGGGLVVAGLTAGLFGVGTLSHEGRFKDATYDLSQAVLVNAAYTFALKSTIHRTRPDGSNALSFPSGHTSTAFAAATVLQSHYGAKVGIPAYGVASFIGASRMASKAHHLSDVLAGAALGYVVGRTVVGNDGRVGRHPKLVLGTAPSPSGDGVGVAVSLGF